MNPDLIPHRVYQFASTLFSEKGYDAVNMADIAKIAGVSEAEIFTFFGNKQDIILFLYKCINTDWQLFVNELSEGKLSERFESAMLKKIDLLHPHVQTMSNIMGSLLASPALGIQSPRTTHIRTMGLQTMQTIINGSTDSRSLKKKINKLPALLYLMHWGILFLHVQSGNKEKTQESILLMSKMLKKANNLSFFLGLFPFLKDVSDWAENLLNEKESKINTLDREILKIIYNHRKTSLADQACKDNNCETCFGLHEPAISFFTSQQKPLHFILPAFPAKSPNQKKVLGKLPDLGEEIALQALEDLCKEIKTIYAPGAAITICSDGRIFSDLVGVNDADISTYVIGIKEIISRLNLQSISVVNLEDLTSGSSFDESRKFVLSKYSEPIEDLYLKLKNNKEFTALFNGIHRFISEDRRIMEPGKSINKIKEEAKAIALQVIQHSNAWTRFLSYIYPDALRLSIHPYPAHNHKIGIRLTKATDNWLTPWHGVIVLQQDGYLLMKKNEAEDKGAKLVHDHNRPYYYTLLKQ